MVIAVTGAVLGRLAVSAQDTCGASTAPRRKGFPPPTSAVSHSSSRAYEPTRMGPVNKAMKTGR